MFNQNCLNDQQKHSKSILDVTNNRNFSSKENIKLGDSYFKFEENKLNFRSSSNTNPSNPSNPFLNFKENKTPFLNFKIKERDNDKTSPTKINFSREIRTREATEIQESSDKINCSKTEVKIKLNFDEENRNMFSVTSKKSKEASSCFKNIFKKENLFLEKENTFNTYNICNNDYLYIDNQKIGDSISLQNLNVNNIQNDLLNITNNDIQSIKSIKSIKSDSINSNPFDKSFCKSSSVSSISSKSDFSNILNNSFYSNMSYNGQPISLGSEVRTFSSMSSFSNFTGSISGFSSVYSDYSSYNESNTTNFTSNERAKSFLSFNQSVSHFSSSGNSQNNLITSNTNNINSNILDNGNYFKIPELENETEESNYYSRESIGSMDKSDSNGNFLEEYEKKLLIPIEKKNDEKYKILKINKFARKTEMPPYKTVRKWEEFKTHDNQDYDDSKYIINFYLRLISVRL